MNWSGRIFASLVVAVWSSPPGATELDAASVAVSRDLFNQYCFPAVVLSAGMDEVVARNGAPGEVISPPPNLGVKAEYRLDVLNKDALAWTVQAANGDTIDVVSGALAFDCSILIHTDNVAEYVSEFQEYLDADDPFVALPSQDLGMQNLETHSYRYIDPLGFPNVAIFAFATDEVSNEDSQHDVLVTLVKLPKGQ